MPLIGSHGRSGGGREINRTRPYVGTSFAPWRLCLGPPVLKDPRPELQPLPAAPAERVLNLVQPPRRSCNAPTLSRDLGPKLESTLGAVPADDRSWVAADMLRFSSQWRPSRIRRKLTIHRDVHLPSDCALHPRSSDMHTTTTASRIAGNLPRSKSVLIKAVPRVYDLRRSWLFLLVLVLALALVLLLVLLLFYRAQCNRQ